MKIIRNGSGPEQDRTDAPLFLGGKVTGQSIVSGDSTWFSFNLVSFAAGARNKFHTPHQRPDPVRHRRHGHSGKRVRGGGSHRGGHRSHPGRGETLARRDRRLRLRPHLAHIARQPDRDVRRLGSDANQPVPSPSIGEAANHPTQSCARRRRYGIMARNPQTPCRTPDASSGARRAWIGRHAHFGPRRIASAGRLPRRRRAILRQAACRIRRGGHQGRAAPHRRREQAPRPIRPGCPPHRGQRAVPSPQHQQEGRHARPCQRRGS